MTRDGIGWRDPKDAAIIMGKVLLALAGAMLLAGATMQILPYSSYSPRTLERFVTVGVFYTVWALLTFKLLFGAFVPLGLFRESGV